MKKDESGVRSWCKHTNNELGTKSGDGRRYINKRVRLNVKRIIRVEFEKGK